MAGIFSAKEFSHIATIFDKHSILHGNGSRRIAFWQLRYVMQELGQNSEDIDIIEGVIQAANEGRQQSDLFVEFDEFIRLMRVIKEKVDAAKYNMYDTDMYEAWMTWGGHPSRIGFIDGRAVFEGMIESYNLDVDIDALLLKAKGERTYNDDADMEHLKDSLDYRAFRELWNHIMKEVHYVDSKGIIPSLSLEQTKSEKDNQSTARTDRLNTAERKLQSTLRKAIAEGQRQKAKERQRKPTHPPTFSVPFPTTKVTPLENFLEKNHSQHNEKLHSLRTYLQHELSRNGLGPDGRNPHSAVLNLRHAHQNANGLFSDRTTSTHSTFGESVDDAWVLGNPDHSPWITGATGNNSKSDVDVYSTHQTSVQHKHKSRPKKRKSPAGGTGGFKLVAQEKQEGLGGDNGPQPRSQAEQEGSEDNASIADSIKREKQKQNEHNRKAASSPTGDTWTANSKVNNKQKVVASGVKKVSTRPVDFWTRRMEAQVRIEALRDQQRWHGQRFKASQMLAKFLDSQKRKGHTMKGASMYIEMQQGDPELTKALKLTSTWIANQLTQVPQYNKDGICIPRDIYSPGGTSSKGGTYSSLPADSMCATPMTLPEKNKDELSNFAADSHSTSDANTTTDDTTDVHSDEETASVITVSTMTTRTQAGGKDTTTGETTEDLISMLVAGAGKSAYTPAADPVSALLKRRQSVSAANKEKKHTTISTEKPATSHASRSNLRLSFSKRPQSVADLSSRNNKNTINQHQRNFPPSTHSSPAASSKGASFASLNRADSPASKQSRGSTRTNQSRPPTHPQPKKKPNLEGKTVGSILATMNGGIAGYDEADNAAAQATPSFFNDILADLSMAPIECNAFPNALEAAATMKETPTTLLFRMGSEAGVIGGSEPSSNASSRASSASGGSQTTSGVSIPQSNVQNHKPSLIQYTPVSTAPSFSLSRTGSREAMRRLSRNIDTAASSASANLAPPLMGASRPSSVSTFTTVGPSTSSLPSRASSVGPPILPVLKLPQAAQP
eukprot:TRINITY_DN2813_c0_g1_i1.p1 TRINITY_DN2813_c0_g1~~TRINITY_DN2813_c0_g1_i1.p1  ORF type:complete len:1012 (-),score=76.24 TRINITY_DN2813_c0_g1_i1:73-3108(-)